MLFLLFRLWKASFAISLKTRLNEPKTQQAAACPWVSCSTLLTQLISQLELLDTCAGASGNWEAAATGTNKRGRTQNILPCRVRSAGGLESTTLLRSQPPPYMLLASPSFGAFVRDSLAFLYRSDPNGNQRTEIRQDLTRKGSSRDFSGGIWNKGTSFQDSYEIPVEWFDP